MKHLVTIFIFISVFPAQIIFSQTAALELEKMNVFYVGVENPIKVAVENYPCNKIVIQPKYGRVKMTSDNCHYSYKIDSCNITQEVIYVGVKNGKIIKWLDTLKYRVKRVPTPVAYICNRHYGLIKQKDFINSNVILALLENVEFDDYAQVSKYSYQILRKNSIISEEKNVKGNTFTKQLKTEIIKSQKGDIYFIFDIYAKTQFDKCSRELQSCKFEIE